MTVKRTTALTFALFFVFALAFQGCSKKADIDDVRKTPITSVPIETTDTAEDEGWSAGDWGVVKVLDINFRVSPSAESLQHNVYPVLFYGTLLEVIGVKGDWINVRFASGVTGWVVTQYEGDEYIRKAELSDLNNATSDTFFKTQRSRIEWFAYDYEIYTIYGSDASLEGTDWSWQALLVADSRPGEKFYITTDGEEVLDIKASDGLPIRLEPYNRLEKPVSSEKVCEYANIADFFASDRVAANRSKIKEALANDKLRIDMALSGYSWQILFVETTGGYDDIGITGHFDAATGEFLNAEGKMSWE
jgi:hypothetical protein